VLIFFARNFAGVEKKEQNVYEKILKLVEKNNEQYDYFHQKRIKPFSLKKGL